MIKQFTSASEISLYIDSKICGSFLISDIEFLGSFVRQLQPNDSYLEVGTQYGKSIASAIWQASEGVRFLTVDLDDLEAPIVSKLSRQQFFTQEGLDQVCRFIQGESTQVAQDCRDNSLAMVFIDGEHTYEAGKKDILAWLPKLKSGGFMLFHDYSDPQFTVKQAIDELVRNSDCFQDFQTALGNSSMAGAIKK